MAAYQVFIILSWRQNRFIKAADFLVCHGGRKNLFV
jgi:hypothetical protein